jgi:hypothetical protein
LGITRWTSGQTQRPPTEVSIHPAQRPKEFTFNPHRMSNCGIALLMNFNSVLLKDGLRRFVP